MIKHIRQKIEEKKEWIRERKRTIVLILVMAFIYLVILYYAILVSDGMFRGKGLRYLLPLSEVLKIPSKEVLQFYLLLVSGTVLLIWLRWQGSYGVSVQTIAGKIKIPRASGSNEHGSARFLTETERERLFVTQTIGSEIDWLKKAGREDNTALEEKVAIIKDWYARRKEAIKRNRGKEKEELRKEFEVLNKEKNNLIAKWEAEDADREKRYERYKSNDNFSLFPSSKSGTIINWEKKGSLERVQVMNEDRHMLANGPTRSGKNRHLIFQTIMMDLLAGINVLVVDVKTENYIYTSKAAKRLGYQTIPLDFREPTKSMKYNFLQPIINALDEDNVPEAINLCWDLVSQLVGEPKGERIWADGEASVIAGSIMAVAYDNQVGERRKFQNLTNVYHFLSEMPEVIDDKGTTKLKKYADNLPEDHPSKALFGISKVAPRRTAGSFYTAALTTLKLFTNPLIYEMTRETTIDIDDLFEKKTAIYLILPDEKKTYHPIATLFVAMFYQAGIKAAVEHGGRLPIKWHMILDEFGNFAKVSEILSMLTAGGGRGFLFLLILQSFMQLEEKYGKEIATIIKDNCDLWIYLNSNDDATKKEFSQRLGTYTIYSYSKSRSFDRYSNLSGNTQSANLTGRELLKPEELTMVDRPYFIVSPGRGKSFVSYSPDISQWAFNDIYGLGDKDYNEKVTLVRNWSRKEEIPSAMLLWGIWKTVEKATKETTGNKYKDNWVSGQEFPM